MCHPWLAASTTCFLLVVAARELTPLLSERSQGAGLLHDGLLGARLRAWFRQRMAPLVDLKGVRDANGYELHATVIAVADELAGAAQLVMGKTDGVPAAVVRGFAASGGGTARELVMPAERDLFR